MDRTPHPGRKPLVTAKVLFSTLYARLLTPSVLLALLLFGGCGLIPAQALPPPPVDALVVSFIDVGQGDAALVRSAGQNYLIDGGRPEAGPEVVSFLRSSGVQRLDGIVATHPDADHIGGLPDVVDAFPVSRVYLSGESRGTSTFNALLRRIRDKKAEVIEARAGLQMDWGGVKANVLAPPPGALSEESNDNSVAVLLTFGSARILLPGDAQTKEEAYMSQGAYTGPLTVLKVGHHGSSSSTTPLFLSRFKPQIAVISVGADNTYGHPTRQTLRRLETVGAKVFRTDKDGDVIVTIKENKVDVAVTKGVAAAR